MYLSYYGLTSKPFQISSDPKFIWLGEKHKEALATLTYGVLDNKGFMLLTGDVGTGKTTLINTLIRNLSDDVLHAFVPDPRLEFNDFLNYVARAFDIRKEFKSKGKFLLYFSDFLEKAYAENKKVLLLIDEAQLLTQELLEEIRLLSNIQKDGNNLLNIFFIGQDEFNQVLERSENRAVAQRLTLNYHLNPLSEAEVGQYIRHRLKVAGTTERLFDDLAVREIHAYSGGFPRRINIICDHCLLNGFAKEKRLVNAEMVRICAHDLKIPQYTRKTGPPPRPIPPSIREPAATSAHVAGGERETGTGAAAGSAAAGAVAPGRRGDYVAGNVDVRVDLQRQKENRLLNGIMTLAVLVCGGLLIFYVIAPRTFMDVYQRVLDELMPLQQSVTRIISEHTDKRDAAESDPDVESEIVSPEQMNSGADSAPEEENAGESVDMEVAGQVRVDADRQKDEERIDTRSDQAPERMTETGQTDSPLVEPEAASLSAENVQEEGRGLVQQAVEEPGEAGSELVGSAPVPVPAPALEIPVTDQQELPEELEPSPITIGMQETTGEQSGIDEEHAVDSVRDEFVAAGEDVSEIFEKVLIVRFNHDSSEFIFEDLEGLEELVEQAKRVPQATIKITGHTDSLGSENYNYRLSLFRANMLKSYFLGKGIAPEQMSVKGYGSEVPVAANDTAEGRRKNRRVEIEIVK